MYKIHDSDLLITYMNKAMSIGNEEAHERLC